MKVIIAAFLAVQMMFLPILAYADPTPKITPMLKGEPAPYGGVLLNGAASAKIKTDKEKAAALCKLKYDYLKMRQSADCQLKVDLLKAELEGVREKNLAIDRIKSEELASLRKIAAKNKVAGVGWWIALGAGVGVILTVASFLLVSQVRKTAE